MEEQSEQQIAGTDWTKYDPGYRAIGDYLGVDPNTEWSDFKNKIEYLKGWAKNTSKSEDYTDHVKALKSLEDKVGKPSWEDRRINHLYRNLRLEEDRVRIKENTKKSNPIKTDPLRATISKSLSGIVQKELEVAKQKVQSVIQQSIKDAVKRL